MMHWVTTTLQSASLGPTALPLALLLGLASALASACCTLPTMGMLVAYSGTREDANRKNAVVSAISFIIGTTLALVVLGLVAGFAGQAAQALLGKYWKLFAGFMAVGLFMGGGVAAASLPCNPGIFIVIGASILMGHTLWGMVLMAAFGVGFSLPLGAILFGVAFGKASLKAQKAEAVIRVVAGVLLIGAGFYLLATF